MPPRESQSLREARQGSTEIGEQEPLAKERPIFREKFKDPQDYLDALTKLYPTDRDLRFWTKDNLRSLVADSGLAHSREDIDRLANEFDQEVHQAENQLGQVVQTLFQGPGVQDAYHKSFGQEVKNFTEAKAQAASLLQPFYELYSKSLAEGEALETQPREHFRGATPVQEREQTKDTVAWEVVAIAIPPTGYSKREQKQFAQRRALWDEAIAKLQLLPGPHQEALQVYLKSRNSATARRLIEQFLNLILPPEQGRRVELKFKREDVRDLEIFLEQIGELTTTLAQKLGLEIKPAELAKEGLTIKEAKDILGQDVLGLEAIEKSFGLKLSPDQIPPIPYTKEQLEKAKELGEMLVLRIDKDKDGQPLTMQRINTQLQPRFTAEKKGKILYDTGWYEAEVFFTQDTPRAGWKLVSKASIPNSTSKDFLGQTKVLRDHLKSINALTEQEAQECIDEQLAQIRQLAGTNWENWQQVVRRLSELKINQNHRRIPVEVIYDFILNFDSNNTRTLESLYDWTGRLSSSGRLVDVGSCVAEGAHVAGWRPAHANSNVGASSLR